MKTFVTVVAVAAVVAVGWAVSSGNAELNVTDQGKQTAQQAQDVAEQSAQDAAEVTQQALQDALNEGKRQIHEATAE